MASEGLIQRNNSMARTGKVTVAHRQSPYALLSQERSGGAD